LLTLYGALPFPLTPSGLFHRNFSQGNPLDGRPNDGQATHLRRKHVNLVGALTHIAEQTLDRVGRSDVAVLFGHAIYALREEYGESTITLKEANELQQAIDALASELTRVQQDCQQQVNLLNAQQTRALATARQELETTVISSLTPERLMASLTGHLETLIQHRLIVSLADMRQTGIPAVSPETPETRSIRLLTPQNVSGRVVRPAGEAVGNGSHRARIYALLNEDRNRKPADLQRLTGIPKATVYRLVERYNREHPVIETVVLHETETLRDEAMSGETETAS
jgi:hypothetical protein